MRKWVVVFPFLAAFVMAPARPQAPEWQSLFNGKDLTGWKHVGPGEMTVSH